MQPCCISSYKTPLYFSPCLLHPLTFRRLLAHEFLIAFHRWSARSLGRFQVTAAWRFHCRAGSPDGAGHSADAIRNRLKKNRGKGRERERERGNKFSMLFRWPPSARELGVYAGTVFHGAFPLFEYVEVQFAGVVSRRASHYRDRSIIFTIASRTVKSANFSSYW